MDSGARPGEIAIGAALAEARARAGLEIAEIERRTKIRVKYLRALEDEHWEELPSNAYAKGFLRTYSAALGLDPELLVDEYRRQVEARTGVDGTPPGEHVLEPGRRPGGAERRRSPLVLALAAAALVAVVVVGVIAVTGGEDDEGLPAGGVHEGEGRAKSESGGAHAGELVRLELRVRRAVEVCLLGAGREPLIDGQLLSAGTRDAYASERFELRFPAGFDRDQIVLKLDGDGAALPAVDGPARFEITPPGRVREASPPGDSCP